MRTIEYYEVGDCYSEDGRGEWRAIACFSSKDVAEEYAKKRGNYEHDATVRREVIIIADSISELEVCDEEKRFQELTENLTPADLALLKKRFKK
jgi:hypothetical protein